MTTPIPAQIVPIDLDAIAKAEGRVVVFSDETGKLDQAARRVNRLTRGAVERFLASRRVRQAEARRGCRTGLSRGNGRRCGAGGQTGPQARRGHRAQGGCCHRKGQIGQTGVAVRGKPETCGRGSAGPDPAHLCLYRPQDRQQEDRRRGYPDGHQARRGAGRSRCRARPGRGACSLPAIWSTCRPTS